MLKKQTLKTALVALLLTGGVAASVLAAENLNLNALAMNGAPLYGPEQTISSYASPEAQKGGRIKMASIGTFDTLNPYSIKGNAADGLNLVYDRLMARMWDEPFTMYPLIAERIEIPEDRSAITFYLNPKAVFHDGSPITAEDVRFSFETLKEEGRPNMRRIYRLVKNISTPNDHEIRFDLGEGYDRETIMILALMPVLSKTFWEGRTFDQTILEAPLLNGPYMIKDFEPGRYITYQRTPNYWAGDLLANAGHYNFDEITYEYYRDDSVALQALKKGDLDIRREYDVSKWVKDYTDLGPDFSKYEAPHQRPERARGFIFNMRRAPFDDINVRKALILAFDSEWIGKNVFFDRFQRIDSVFPNSKLKGSGEVSPDVAALLSPWKDTLPADIFEPDYPPLPTETDLRKRLREASKLLNEAGWKVKDGVRVKDGKPLSFEILLNSPEDEKIAIHYKKSLERLGITLNIRTMDTASFQDRLRAYEFDMVSYFWQNSLSPGTEQMLYWSCESAKIEARWNYPGLCHPAIDHLAKATANATDYESLTNNAKALDRAIMSRQMMIPLFYGGKDLFVHKYTIKHPEQTPIYGSVLETWWMDQVSDTNQD